MKLLNRVLRKIAKSWSMAWRGYQVRDEQVFPPSFKPQSYTPESSDEVDSEAAHEDSILLD